MRYASIRSMDISNGQGVGVSLFVQGCHFHCEDCFNQETWDFNGGYEWTQEIEDKLINLINRPYITRFSLLGGEPLADENVDTVIHILKVIRNTIFQGTKTIWMYTGYTWERVHEDKNLSQQCEAISLCDVLVDGRYNKELKDYKYQWAGSTNQRIIDVQESLKNKKVVLFQ